ncbi:hypothetical protein C8A05DRAFT_30213 [Staphylotrichum tortipilum]|uniref:DUF7730 domain-containing protein n=1 Tax=Staphylotrichum tortipilum TaxID=2831512 RepID=A0AAN6RXP0_9PEZI|nr:hypothetical protein C8A05DRAFT_30213 [Staphylotrichum longicolle]
MDFIRDALRGKFSTHRQPVPPSPEPPEQPPHPLDTLPRLPSPRRPITPLPALPQHPHSPFFALPPELRNQIYLLLLSAHTFHLDLRYTTTSTGTTPHSLRGATLACPPAWRWRSSTCHRRPTSHALAHRALALLRCCRLADREVHPVLYGANTLHVETGAVVLHTAALLPAAGLVTEESMWECAGHVGMESGPGAFWVLVGRLPEAFPGLVALEVLVGGLFRAHQGGLNEQPLRSRRWVLDAMDGVVRGFGGRLGEEGVVAMAGPVFDKLIGRDLERARRVEAREGMWVQFWRPVSVAVGEETVETGYWVRRVAEETAQAEWMDSQLEALASSI